ncbi:NAD-dependent succinate-semialdehyde dehydrogenase [Moheibacter sediminis]|uniref:Succinate-semialdehyde dehydrogenase / glutarate-semialdehyde dehydrogenase n=1 Tax=Moheibacter sediminis TaxID=1434700 RepID=A0A1W2AYQ7_9FLAO|nr:NAD-dependent succinate-semialdehyde dehydrogenase [Moheibacter sediminis]SMC65823.1 succinate-semialdehyde dehydrogenase / glutarate-semialdehyde dehydrogenase [Moheibacter sediminis]
MSQNITIQEAIQKVELANEIFTKLKIQQADRPLEKMLKVGEILLAKKDEFARVITSEMGKPVFESIAEIEKSALNCEFYVENVAEFLKDRKYETDRYDALVRYEPLGVILGVMPWNFPFWQVFRFAVPTILAGNTVVVKHASNVPKSAQLIEEIFLEAGFEKGTYQNIPLDSKHIQEIIELQQIKAVSLTGSEKAGSAVASVAGKEIKKTVLELGGSNAFIVMDDADLDKILEKAINARYRNAGQSCIAAKRFLVQEGIFDEFLEKFTQKVKELKVGDPFDAETQIGPLARVDLAEEAEKQVSKSVEMGAKIVFGGKRDEAFYYPTVITEITDEMPVFKEETFAPIAVVRKFKTFEEAIELSNKTSFGLGVSICSKNIEEVSKKVHLFEEGAVFFNELVRSDPKLPFGGVKKSGFGRELSEEGIREFTNIKTIFFSKS